MRSCSSASLGMLILVLALALVCVPRWAPLSLCVSCTGANYRSVWALHKHFPNVKIYVRAHDVTHGLNLEKVGGPISFMASILLPCHAPSSVLSKACWCRRVRRQWCRRRWSRACSWRARC